MLDKLTQEQIDEYRDAFKLFDKDNSGSISAEEIASVLKSLGQSPTTREIDDLINEIDADGNKSISFEEFLLVMTKKIKPEDIDAEIIEAFKFFDKDSSGSISKEELLNVLITIGEEVNETEARQMVEAADIDGDGQIDIEEFSKILRGK